MNWLMQKPIKPDWYVSIEDISVCFGMFNVAKSISFVWQLIFEFFKGIKF